MIFRLSQKLNVKIKAGPLSPLLLDDSLLADWSAHTFLASRTQFIILSNTKSLYSTVIYGKGITNQSQFIERAFSGIRELMEDDGQESVYRKFIAPASGSVQFAKALNRSVTGSMNDLIAHATVWLTEDGLSPGEVGIRLNDTFLSALARSKAFPYGTPREAFKLLLDGVE